MEQKRLASFSPNDESSEHALENMVRICTFNVNSIKARIDLVLNWLEYRSNDLDMLCFQELKVADNDFPFREFERFGFSCEVYGQKGYNGVAICSKLPLENVRKGLGDENWDYQKRIVRGKVLGINLINVYFPHGDLRGTDKYNYKIEWFEKFVTFLKENYMPEEKIIVVGDFNVAISDLDVFDPEITRDCIGTMFEEREAFNEVLEWGLIDSFRRLYPEKQQFTWWDYIGGAIWKNEGMRIDYVLCTKSLVDKIREIDVDLWPRRRRTPKPSDHAPVTMTLEL